MHLLNIVLIHIFTIQPDSTPEWIKLISTFAPVLTFFAAIANLSLAIYIFKYTRRKNDNDVKIKWFQELLYIPNKDNIANFFKALHDVRSDLILSPDGSLTEENRINVMNKIKGERQKIMSSFVDAIKPIAENVHSQIHKSVDKLVDDLTNTFDDDELKFSNEKTYTREVTSKINHLRNQILIALFNYKG